MLEGLDSIDWKSLGHAYGSAEDVPALLRQRASPEKGEADAAQGELFSNIWHQGTVYEATTYAVHFLVELVVCPETHSRYALILLLAEIAEGHSYLEVHQHLEGLKMNEEPGFDVQLREELTWKDRARRAVAEHAHHYWALLDDPALRISIPYLLSKLPEERNGLLARAAQILHSETDPLFKASMLFSLASARSGVDDFHPFLSDEHPAIRAAVALGVLLNQEDLGDDIDAAMETFLEVIRTPARFDLKDAVELGWLWGCGNLKAVILESIPFFTETAKRRLVQRLPSILTVLNQRSASVLALSVRSLVFSQEALPKNKYELTEVQRLVLLALSRVKNVSYSDPLIQGLQANFGISYKMEELAKYLEEP